MNNFKVLLKYSLKPKLYGKKQVLAFLGIIMIPLLLISIGGSWALSTLEEDGSSLFDLDIADVTYIYPDNQISQSLATQFSEPVILDEKPDAEQLFKDDDDKSQVIIDLENNQIISEFQVQTQQKMIVQSLIDNFREGTIIADFPEEYRTKLESANSKFEFISVDNENDNHNLLYGLNILNSVVIYFIIVFGFQLLGNEIFEEKSSRAMEVIITNTRPKTHMLVKILSTLIFLSTLIVSLVIGVLGGIAILAYLNPDSVGMITDSLIELLTNLNLSLDYTFVLFIIFTVLSGLISVLLFQIIGAALASMATTYEDYQKANAPLIMVIFIPYLISIMGIDAIANILVYFPLFTPFFAPNLFLSGDISIVIFGICVLIQAVSTYIIYHVSAPVYREGLLNYSTSSLREIIKRSYTK